ncbi:TVA4 protein, partial [Nothocercus nigrocapillus]|nr:TVA4 protein [Nothocercus nigrocapillus]
LFLAVAVGRAQVQQEPLAEASEGTSINITCSHLDVTANSVQWYQQRPHQPPQLIARGFGSGEQAVPEPAGTLLIAADRRSSVLRLSRPRWRDAAVYYCAVSD